MSNPKRMSYKEFVEKLKTGHVYTHNGDIHASDVLSTALIELVCEKEGIEIPKVHRISDVDLANNMSVNNIVYDIGVGEFEHSQPGNETRETGAPYTSFGKIFEVVGQELFGEYVAEQLNAKFVKKIDLCDNSKDTCSYSKLISSMNPKGNEIYGLNEKQLEEKMYDCFEDAVWKAKQSLVQRSEIIFDGHLVKDLTELVFPVEEDWNEKFSLLNDICAQASEGYEEYSNQENNTNVAANTQNSDDGQNISSNITSNPKEDFSGTDGEDFSGR